MRSRSQCRAGSRGPAGTTSRSSARTARAREATDAAAQCDSSMHPWLLEELDQEGPRTSSERLAAVIDLSAGAARGGSFRTFSLFGTPRPAARTFATACGSDWDRLALAPGHGDPAVLLLEDAPFTVVDIETTGTSAGADGITEIAAVRIRSGAVEGTFSTLIDPQRAIPPWITTLTGISDEMVHGRPTIAEALPEFLSFLGNDVLVAHNAPFDRGFLSKARERLQGVPLQNPTLCTVRLARRYLPRLRKRDLDSVTRHLGIVVEGRHRALGDAAATAQVLVALLVRPRRAGARPVGVRHETGGTP